MRHRRTELLNCLPTWLHVARCTLHATRGLANCEEGRLKSAYLNADMQQKWVFTTFYHLKKINNHIHPILFVAYHTRLHLTFIMAVKHYILTIFDGLKLMVNRFRKKRNGDFSLPLARLVIVRRLVSGSSTHSE